MAADAEVTRAWHAAEAVYLTHRKKLLNFFFAQ